MPVQKPQGVWDFSIGMVDGGLWETCTPLGLHSGWETLGWGKDLHNMNPVNSRLVSPRNNLRLIRLLRGSQGTSYMCYNYTKLILNQRGEKTQYLFNNFTGVEGKVFSLA